MGVHSSPHRLVHYGSVIGMNMLESRFVGNILMAGQPKKSGTTLIPFYQISSRIDGPDAKLGGFRWQTGSVPSLPAH